MAVHTFTAYSDSINRFSPKYEGDVLLRMYQCLPLIHKLLRSMSTQMMMLDMLKAYVFYGKPVHEVIESQLVSLEDVEATTPKVAQFFHGLLGILTECNELYLDYTRGGLAKINGIGEIGDLLWFVNEDAKALSVTLAEAAAVNEAKLSTRYGEAHDSGKAINRDKAKEEAAMQAALSEVRSGKTEHYAAMYGQSGYAMPEPIGYAIPEPVLRILAQVLPPLEDACRHNASKSQRVTAARIRELLNLEPYLFKHGANYDGNGNPRQAEADAVGGDSGNGVSSDVDGRDQASP